MKSLSQSDKVGYLILLILCGTLAINSVASRIPGGRLLFNVVPLLVAFALPPIYCLVRRGRNILETLALSVGFAGISMGVLAGFTLLAIVYPSAKATQSAALNIILPIIGVGACLIALRKTDQNEEYQREYERKHPMPDFANMTQDQAMVWMTETQAEVDGMPLI